MKSPANVPSEVAKDIKEVLMTPGQNYGKDNYTIDLTGSDWIGTNVLLGTSTSMGHVHPETGHVMSHHSRWVRDSLQPELTGRSEFQPSGAGCSPRIERPLFSL
jgi:hypothetical protein